jgi:hypothetical protein
MRYWLGVAVILVISGAVLGLMSTAVGHDVPLWGLVSIGTVIAFTYDWVYELRVADRKAARPSHDDI